jgi:hypothetical protein
MCDLRNVSSAYAMPGMSSSAAPCEYGHETAGGSAREENFGPRLSLDMSDGSDVKSVYGVPGPVLVAADAADRAGAEELSVKGEGGVV